MAFRLYFVPAEGTGTRSDPHRPTYLQALGEPWSGMTYGAEPLFLVGANLSAAADASLAGQADVFALPVDLDARFTGPTLGAFIAFLATHQIPTDWVSTRMGWREALRTIAGLMQYLQRVHGLGHGRLFTGGVTLDTAIATLPVATQDHLLAAARSLGYSDPDLAGGRTLRALLRDMGDAWGTRAIVFTAGRV